MFLPPSRKWEQFISLIWWNSLNPMTTQLYWLYETILSIREPFGKKSSSISETKILGVYVYVGWNTWVIVAIECWGLNFADLSPMLSQLERGRKLHLAKSTDWNLFIYFFAPFAFSIENFSTIDLIKLKNSAVYRISSGWMPSFCLGFLSFLQLRKGGKRRTERRNLEILWK